jgi:hypothetical protein
MAPQLMESIDDRGGLDEGNLTVVPKDIPFVFLEINIEGSLIEARSRVVNPTIFRDIITPFDPIADMNLNNGRLSIDMHIDHNCVK